MSELTTIDHVKDGARWSGSSARTTPVHDPATGEITAELRLADERDADEVVRSAREAFDGWRRVPLGRRTDVLFAFRELVDRHRDELAALITREHGKVLGDAAGEVARGLEVVDHACGLATHLRGAASWNVSTDVDARSMRQPVGVVAGVTPFNFPVMVPMWMHPVAIACGNSFVLKPSEKVPSAAMLVADLWAQAGLPDGVFSVLHGDGQAVDALLEHPEVDAVSFVGSTPVARHVYGSAARRGARVQALGGAKNHMVVLPDADIGTAADAAVGAAYGSAGERCMAVSVLVAVGAIADDLVDAVRSRIETLRVGPGTDPASQMGPLITREHRDRVARLVRGSAADGAKLVVDRTEVTVPGYEGGYWHGPCLVDEVTPDQEIYREEVFGPVLSVVRVDDAPAALHLVNDNPYGNGAAIFTNDGAVARWFETEVTAGMVGVNVPIPVPMAYYSFGGWKDSFFGTTHVHGPEGVAFYTRNKTTTHRWRPTGLDLAFPGNRE